MEELAPYPAINALDAGWPFLVGFGLFVLIDQTVALDDSLRIPLLLVFAAPGAIWLLYLLYRNFRAILRNPSWKEDSNGRP
jgi:hypothetical protein